jgi:glycosyltransferase involved in cell wall biosynthesis
VAFDAPEYGALNAWERGRRLALLSPMLRFIRNVRRAAKDCDAALAHWTLPCGMLASVLGLPTVGIAHGGDVRLLRRYRLQRLTTRLLKGVIAVSNEMAMGFEGIPTLVCPMGVSSARFDGLSHVTGPVRRILFVGRLERIKGVEVLLRAVRGLELQVTVVGGGPLFPTLHATYPDVHFLGSRPRTDIPRLMATHDLVVVPSVGLEGAPVVVAEACAAQRAVLAADIGGLRDMVPAAMRFPPGDVTALRRRLHQLSIGDEVPALVGDRRRFDWGVTGDKISTFLTSVLK